MKIYFLQYFKQIGNPKKNTEGYRERKLSQIKKG